MREAACELAAVCGLILLVLTACGGASAAGSEELRCPRAQGEFPPVGCAIVRGTARDSLGRPLTGLGIAVDSFVPRIAYAYSGQGTTIGQDGTFQLLVYRVSQLRPPTDPDTASVELKLYTSPVPNPGTSALAATLVLLEFAPMGAVVAPARVQVRFPYAQ